MNQAWIKHQRKRVVTRLLDDGDRYPWAVFVDGKIAHRDGNRASAWAWADRKRTQIINVILISTGRR